MTITLSKEEFETFQSAMAIWYNERSRYILQNYQDDPSNQYTRNREVMDKMMVEWETKHPKPDWRSLL